MSPADDSYLLIDLGGQAFALPMGSVREVLPLPVLDRQPPWPKILAGMINLRGQAMPVLDLGLLLSAGADRETTDLYAHIVRVVGRGGAQLGLLVDRVTDAQMPADGFKPAEPDESPNGAALGHLRFGERLVPLLAPDRLLLLEEAARIEEITAALADRRQAVSEGRS